MHIQHNGCCNIKLVMAGRDVTTENRELKSFIAEHDLEHLVVLLGEVSKTEALNPMFDVAVSSSSWGEGFSNTITSDASAIGSAFTLSNGVYFLRGTFVDVSDD